MDLRKVKKLIELLEASGLTEIKIVEGDDSIRLSRGGSVAAVNVPTAAPMIQAAPAAPSVADVGVSSDEAAKAVPAGHAVESPTVGTYYSRSGPEAEPFVSIGSEVKAGDVLCIVEAMKTFNEIQADKAGTIAAILKDEGDPVEFGEALFIIS